MNFKFFLLFLIGSLATMHAQNPGSLSGKVIDKTSSEPLPYVSIVVKENDKVVTGGITDDKGEFVIKNLPLNTYTVEIQFMGYKTNSLSANINNDNKAVSIGTIVLAEAATELNEVEIVNEISTIEQKIDRKVITVGRDLTTAGGTASEIMNNIPSVNVDQDGNISLRGNQNVRVLVDGRPTNMSPAQLLKQIPSTSIKKIELITNPSAKYNPEGMSGIINIILHKNANDGFNGSFNAGITFGETPKYNNSVDMNYRTGKVNFFTNLGSNTGKYFNDGYVAREDINSRQVFDITNDNDGFLGKIGMDYYINDNNTLSVYTNQNYGEGLGNVGIDITYPPGSVFTDTYQLAVYDTDNRNNAYNIAYKHKFEKEGHTLDFEGNYNDDASNQDAEFTTTVGNITTVYNDKIEDDGKNITMNLDYVNPINEKSTLELGAEARIIGSENNYTTTNPNVTNPALQNSNYTYDLNIYSAYATFGQKFEKFSYQLGARFESYKAEANFNRGDVTFNDDYITVYPSAYLTYTLDEKNMFQISYSRRVDRPSLQQTKPVREFATPLVTSLGNQYLRPQFTNSVELNYTKMVGQGSSITAGVFYRLINDEISRILYPDETTENTQDQIMSFGNFDRNTAFGFEVSANYKITKWWNIQPAIDFSSISQKGVVSMLVDGTTDEYESVIKEVDVAAFNARLNSNFSVNERLSFLLFGFYRGAVDGVQNNSKDMHKIDSGARYTLLDNKMSLSLRFNDMFNTMRYGFDSNNPFPQNGEFRWESRSVYFGLNYRFGGGKNRAMQRKQRDDNTKQSGGGMF
ncbi:TonB-dependent receptor [Flavobacterium salilacus subsp. salilacus]|uniref:TonB-dependent receptor domain-containing protein n=1 Tax=Flavobacterium TaxID=237 RepID=UPI0010751C19|nr:MULTISPECIES: TonB-dependent receptor [Flavobacterium]KAF2519720.1 TonB-dependent receptor [Flavobacterium salilacus subsp. salilacus]MBE1614391.1 TonB-dependent receptor [Flavobacterium sp. SaA2.13]